MKRFQVWLVEFNPARGAEIKKNRPAVIVSNDSSNKYLDTVIVAPLTSAGRKWPTRVDTEFEGNGGQIALDQIRVVDKSRLSKKIGVIDSDEAVAVSSVLQAMFAY